MYYGHPDNPENLLGGLDIDNEELSDLEDQAFEASFEAKREDVFESMAEMFRPKTNQ